MTRRIAMLALLALLTTLSYAQTASVGHERISVQGDSSVVQITLTPKAATSLLADQVPSRVSSEVDAGGETLVVEYDAESRIYRVEERTYTSVSDVRKYVRTWLRAVLGVK